MDGTLDGKGSIVVFAHSQSLLVLGDHAPKDGPQFRLPECG